MVSILSRATHPFVYDNRMRAAAYTVPEVHEAYDEGFDQREPVDFKLPSSDLDEEEGTQDAQHEKSGERVSDALDAYTESSQDGINSISERRKARGIFFLRRQNTVLGKQHGASSESKKLPRTTFETTLPLDRALYSVQSILENDFSGALATMKPKELRIRVPIPASSDAGAHLLVINADDSREGTCRLSVRRSLSEFLRVNGEDFHHFCQLLESRVSEISSSISPREAAKSDYPT